MRGHFTDAQRDVLLRPIMPNRVSHANGMSHVEAYDILAHLSRIFGFEGWDKEILSCELLFEDQMPSKKDATRTVWSVAYRAAMRLTVYAPDGDVATVKEDVSVGDAQMQPSRADAHDLAMKSAVSTALKRCAKDLGDGFGLSLYDHGSTDPLVKRVVPYGITPPEAKQEYNAPDPAQHPMAVAEEVAVTYANRAQQTKLRAALHGIGVNENDDVHQWVSAKLLKPVESLSALTSTEISNLIQQAEVSA
jgi:recombination DNA repair RAD52 pathway protein